MSSNSWNATLTDQTYDWISAEVAACLQAHPDIDTIQWDIALQAFPDPHDQLQPLVVCYFQMPVEKGFIYGLPSWAPWTTTQDFIHTEVGKVLDDLVAKRERMLAGDESLE